VVLDQCSLGEPEGREFDSLYCPSSLLGLYRLVPVTGSHEVNYANSTRLLEKIVEAGRD
jgi:hypothetical protein